MNPSRFSLVIHGGYGGQKNMPRVNFLTALLQDGFHLLKSGAKSVDVVEQMVEKLEDSGLFNAGKGSVATTAGTFEADAAIMDGATNRAGAVALLTNIKNPIRVARAVLDKGQEILLVGPGAVEMARSKNLPRVEGHYFHPTALEEPKHFGTVGCVALDLEGHLAAATSTGGTRNKPPGRVGDSPIIGAGTYANDKTCAISATGKGEFFILANAAHLTSSLMELREMPLQESLAQSLKRVEEFGGTGGMIAVDAKGRVSFAATERTLLCAGAITDTGKIFFPVD